MKKYLILVFVLLYIGEMFSQPPTHRVYIVTLSNDTLYGKGVMKPNNKVCVFKEEGAKKQVTYYPGDITAFRYLDSYLYLSKEVIDDNNEKQLWFLELLVDGEVDLYRTGHNGHYFLEREGEPLLELTDDELVYSEIDGKQYSAQNKKYIGYMRYFLKDAPEVYEEIDDLDGLTQKDLVEIIVEYHFVVCSDYDCIDFTKKLNRKSSAHPARKNDKEATD